MILNVLALIRGSEVTLKFQYVLSAVPPLTQILRPRHRLYFGAAQIPPGSPTGGTQRMPDKAGSTALLVFVIHSPVPP